MVKNREKTCSIPRIIIAGTHSGCGKTTLIKCLAGIISPTEGEIYFDGKLINDLPLEERGIGYVFQETALFPHMTVLSNVMEAPVRVSPSKNALLLAPSFTRIRLGTCGKSTSAHLFSGVA
jgi:ABC-type polar amino acid transport system ATPase subunit